MPWRDGHVDMNIFVIPVLMQALVKKKSLMSKRRSLETSFLWLKEREAGFVIYLYVL